MKKIVLILGLVMLIGMAVGHAHIARETDNFTLGQKINSENDTSGQIDSVSLTKIINSNSTEYELSINKRTRKMFALAKTTIEVKVDDNPSHKFDVQNLQTMPTEDPYIYSYYIKTSMDQNIIAEIKNAKRIALRVELVDGSQPVLVLREYILNEWQQVINIEK
ncbi:hypothetical protein [Pelosinus propionicus]|uniref:Uncharacterized protein n=1 Tax=Pelosinus propionicus DSM 13327 TaxID=1123291 RepID=A0A1I4K9W7_9FIRM|nr:hypothetical protein [Pelosinus propionicus]SFL75449.1 hypothetical protein SAMN04490355_101671 [Pelosinus propionicus DSM 13327]